MILVNLFVILEKNAKKIQVDNGLCNIHEIQRIPITCLSCQGNCLQNLLSYFFFRIIRGTSSVYIVNKAFDIEFLLGYDTNKIQRFSKSFIWGPWKDHREDVY